MTDTVHMHPTDQHPFMWGHYDRCFSIPDAVRLVLKAATSHRDGIEPDYLGELVVTVKCEPEQITVQLWKARP